MSLQFVIGRSGCGKSYYVYEDIIKEAVRDPGNRFFAIVPEQFSMQTQKELVQISPRGAILNIDVLSFNRLAYRVFEETGGNDSPVIDDSGKVLVIQKILSEYSDELKILKGIAGKSSAASTLNSFVSELMQYRINTEILEKLIDDEDLPALLRYKLEDLKLVSDHFSKYLEKKYMTVEEVPERLSRIIYRSEMLKDAVVVFDGFTGFVPAQLLVIEKILKKCRKVIVVLNGDEKTVASTGANMSDLFYMTQQCRAQLSEICRQTGVAIEDTVYIDGIKESRFGNNPELDHLERSLFRYGKGQYQNRPETIYAGEASDCAEEIRFAAETILRLVREEGYMFRDFAFVTGALDDYGDMAENVFSENGINCFLDKKQNILTNRVVEYIRSAVELACGSFSSRSVLRYLRSGLSDIAPEETDLLETYVLAFGVRSRKGYEREWKKTCRTIKETDLEKLNGTRLRFLEEVSDYLDDFKKRNSDIRSRTKALYELLVKIDAAGKCDEYKEHFESEGSKAKAREYDRIYDTVMDYFDKLVEIMGDDRVSLKTYRQILDAGFADLKIGLVPPAMDQVTIGDIERTRLTDIKVLFAAGMNEGTIPKTPSRITIVSGNERKLLEDKNIRLAPDPAEEMYRQRLYLYLTLTKPSERLYITYRRTDSAGSPMLPSYIINVLKGIFPGLSVKRLASRHIYDRFEVTDGLTDLLIKGINEKLGGDEEAAFREIIQISKEDPGKGRIINDLKKGILAQRPSTDISKRAAGMLYKEGSRYSASRLELYGECAFAHFLKYGLRVKERDEFEITSADIGSILHFAIKTFCEVLEKKGAGNISAEERDAMADSALQISFEHEGSIKYNEDQDDSPYSGSDIYLEERLKRLNRSAAWAVSEQLKRGSFKLYAMEEPFYENEMRGVIDRIDVSFIDDVSYIRVIDYKSGRSEVSLNDLYYGLQIQLPMYLAAADRIVKKDKDCRTAESAGMYYCNITDPFVKVDSLSAEADEEALLKLMKLSGYSREEAEILVLHDNGILQNKRSSLISAALKKDGTPDSRSKVLAGADFDLIKRYAKKVVTKQKKLIESGSAQIDPKKGKKSDSCMFCPYDGICRFDDSIKGYRKQYINDESDTEILVKIAEAVTKEES